MDLVWKYYVACTQIIIHTQVEYNRLYDESCRRS